jgi:imidazoleglycerol-phosphate dehydratase
MITTSQPARIAGTWRKSSETSTNVKVNIDGKGDFNITTKVPFFTHLLQTLARHGKIDIDINAEGDLDHHVVEDASLLLGISIREALGDRKNIHRFGFACVPMDDSLARCVVDLSNRAYYIGDLKIHGLEIEGMKVEDIDHLLFTLAQGLKANVHVKVIYGKNDHHKVEAAVKALALALRMAMEIDVKMLDETPPAESELDTG